MVMGDLPVETQLLVLGDGPGGYAAAFRAADLGLDVTLVGSDARPGGVCLLRGCIPSKALLHLAELTTAAGEAAEMGLDLGLDGPRPRWDLERVRGWTDGIVGQLSEGLAELCERRGIQRIRGRGAFAGPRRLLLSESDYSSIDFEHAIIATGSRPAAPPGIDMRPDGRIMDSTGALALADVPQRLLVVGGGYVGLELGSVYAAAGSKVSVVETAQRLLPGVDADLVRPLQVRLETLFESIRLETSITSAEEDADQVQVSLTGPDGDEKATFDRVLVAIGRRPNSEGLGLEAAGVDLDDAGYIRVDAERRTSAEGIFAVGDVAGGMQLAHEAICEGKVAADVIAGHPAACDARAVPAVIYTDPQIAWCGLTEADSERQGRDVRISRFPWRASGRALTMSADDGMTKLVLEPETGRVLGFGAVGRGAEALAAEAMLAVEMGALAEDLALGIHPHPTLSEALGEAAERFLGTPTHLAPESVPEPAHDETAGRTQGEKPPADPHDER
jgi:dihydrolipoamide dehydrogenase